ncbi:MAG: HAMP domain-containing protein, partial [Gammaproteobacteria bacterium]|nr:HAMP domain-containing protein [Gammaproteobacteria bacterium]
MQLSVLEDVAKLNADMRRTEISTVTAFAALSAIVVLVALWLFNHLLFRPVRSMIGDMKRCASGDLEVSVDNRAVTEFHALADAFNVMTQKVRDNIEHERQTAADITDKVGLILEVVEQASEGDLTGRMMVFSDRDVIARLAEGIGAMVDNLNSLVAQVQRSGMQVTSSAGEIAATAKQQEAAVAEQAAST